MHARVSRFSGQGRGAPNPEDALARLRGMDGFRGMISLVDRAGGASMAITLWESEEAMRQSEEAAAAMRQDMAETAGDQISGVERYEVDAFAVEDSPPS